MANPEVNPTTTTGGALKVSMAAVAAAPRTPSQVADTEVKGVTPKDQVGAMVEEINVFAHSLSFWLAMLR